MARVEQAAGPVPARRHRISPGRLGRSLIGKLVLLLIVFVTVPVILYYEFQQADLEKRDLLLESARAQGRLIAESLRPLLEREDPSPLPELNEVIKPFATPKAGIKVLFRPAESTGLEGFYFVASEPPVPPAVLEEARDTLWERGVLDMLAESCEGQIPLALRHGKAGAEEELFTSITPVTAETGCWAVITTHTAQEMLGTAIDQPYWKTIEVQVAAAIYLCLVIFTLGTFVLVWRGLMRFRDTARSIGSGGTGGPGFVEQNEVEELSEVAEEFDRMTLALRDSAETIRRAAEDNAHAFKTPIAIMRQSLEPVKRVIPKDNPRGRRALDVIEESIDRLDHLVASARRLDQTTAELLDPPRHPINLSVLLEHMLNAYLDSIKGRGLALKLDLEANVVVLAGEDLVETVVENVVDNGIEVAPAGTDIEVVLRRVGRAAEVSVRDRGPGVAPEDLERIFERYVSLRSRSRAAPARTACGAEPPQEGEREAIGPHVGIGLWIVRRNLEAIGGSVRAENREDGGLAVIMRLPLA